ncbi:MAG TPA: DoxX family protein [Acidobacteria bacterium]|jgi:putative oxidoreductase|nr:DoxX family protein [Acidobacteriota bacterium]|tara:strand:+ start:551 stop:1018 length:468 start_codon:yes stop_codon:yes gene_type:complete
MHGGGITILRLVLGVVFLAHGLPKLLPVFGGSPAETAAMFEASGLQPALLLVLIVGVIELFGGAAIILGVWTRFSAILLAINMGVAIWKIHLPHGFFLNLSLEPGVGHGYEFAMVLLGGLVCLLLSGPGAVSIDGYRARTGVTRSRRISQPQPKN